MEVVQESIVETLLKNNIARGDNITQATDIKACVSIAGMKPKYRSFTSSKGNFGVFIPTSDSDFFNQLKTYSTFLQIVFSPESFIAIHCESLIMRFHKVHNFLFGQFQKYGAKRGNHFVTLIYNLFNSYFSDIKSGEENNLEFDYFFHRLVAGEDLNLGSISNDNFAESGNGQSGKKRNNKRNWNRNNDWKNRNNNTNEGNGGNNHNNSGNNNRGNNNYNNNNKNGGNGNNGNNGGNQNNRKGWILNGRFGDFFNPDKNEPQHAFL